jgi:hypothetical protein
MRLHELDKHCNRLPRRRVIPSRTGMASRPSGSLTHIQLFNNLEIRA